MRSTAAQGHVLAAGDFMATLVVEATIHHLDLLADGNDRPGYRIVRTRIQPL